MIFVVVLSTKGRPPSSIRRGGRDDVHHLAATELLFPPAERLDGSACQGEGNTTEVERGSRRE